MEKNNQNIWAPWRMEYLKTFSCPENFESAAQGGKCFFCRYWENPAQDRENLVLWRCPNCLVLFNRFPYTAGHLLIVPRMHVPDLNSLDDKTLLETMILSRDAQQALTQAIHPQGFNIGININRCAGAGLPDHLHLHLVPRWEGDTNFMSVIGNARVISQALDELYHQLSQISQQLNLPTVK